MADDKKTTWFDRPGNLKRFLRVFYGLLVVLVLADFFVHKHSYFPFEDAPGFFAIYGFISCVLLVLVAKQMRRLLMRDEDYYDD